jgi:hypothetical protein
MSPAQRHGILAAASLAPAIAYEWHEIAHPDGWPYSRFLSHIPPAVFIGALGAGTAWLIPHILRYGKEAIA